MSKLSSRFKDTHEEIINSTYNIKCKCTDELKNLYNNEELDPTMCLGKITHEFWNNFNCDDTPFIWGYGEGSQQYYRLDDVTQNISNTTSVCLLRTSQHTVDANIGIDTTTENTIPYTMKLITDIDTSNLVLACYSTNWDNSVSWWVDNTERPTSWNLFFKLFYKVNIGGDSVRLIDMTRQISIGIINDNKISSYLDYYSLSRASYAVQNNNGDNTFNFGLQGRKINGALQWWGNQEKNHKNKTSTDYQYITIGSSYYEFPYYRHPIINAIQYPFIVEIIASLGLPFILTNPETITTENDFNSAVHLAYMDENGNVDYTTILTGKDAINNSDTYNKIISYDTIPQIDTNTYIDRIPLNENFFTFTSTAFTEMYALNWFDTVNLKSDMESAPSGFDPLKSIVNMQSFPFEVNTQYITHGLRMGGQVFGTDYKEIIDPVRTLDLGRCNIPKYHNNYMDYAPFTDIKLYIPYCSEVDIPPSLASGKTLSVKLIVDLSTGQCVACVYCNDNIIAYSSGIIGADITVSNNGASLKSASMLQSMLGVGGSVIGLASSVATGNSVGVLGSAYGMVTSVSNGLINENKNYTESKGSTSGLVNNIKPQFCYCVITTVKPVIPADFGHTVGYITNEYKQISQCDGYTVCENVDTNGLSCHSESRARIKAILESGFYA